MKITAENGRTKRQVLGDIVNHPPGYRASSRSRSPVYKKGWIQSVLLLAIVAMTNAAPVLAGDGSTSDNENLFDLSLEELMDMEVVSASRKEQKVTDSPVPVSVVTAEDIHYSGLTNLYEILQFTPSMDMVQVDRNRYALGVRGLHDTWSDRTLTLINGRMADSPIFGGSEFLRQPLFLEDIKQIEILRGPSGAAWGANAFNGAINIITKNPTECEGLFLSSGVDHFGDTYHQGRWADTRDKWAWRVSAGYTDVVSSSEALNDDFTTLGAVPVTFESEDFRRNTIIDTELHHDLSDRTHLSFGLGHSDMETGGYEFLYVAPTEDSWAKTTRAFGQVEKTYDDDRKLSAQWYGTFTDDSSPTIGDFSSSENQLESQWDFSPHPDHRSTIGGNVRFTNIYQDMETPQDMFFGDSREERAGVFLVDRWQATERLTVEGQVYGEWYSETHSDWAARLSAVQALDEQHRHIVRVAGARSYRTPLVALREITTTRLGGLVRVLPNDGLDNEGVWSVEAGYSTQLRDNMTLRLDGYYQEYKDLIRFTELSLGQYVAQNLGRAEAYGWESELILRGDMYRASVWYAYNYFLPKGRPQGIDDDVEVRAFLPARHKAGATLRFFLPHDWTVNLNYKHSASTDASHGPWGEDIPAFDRLDLTLSRAFRLDAMDAEVLLGLFDVFNDTEQTVGDLSSALYLHETPGRTFLATLFLQF